MSNRAHFYSEATVFHGLERPEKGIIVGYAAIIDKLVLNIPIHKPVALIKPWITCQAILNSRPYTFLGSYRHRRLSADGKVKTTWK